MAVSNLSSGNKKFSNKVKVTSRTVNKALRLISEKRVVPYFISDFKIAGLVKGDHGLYNTLFYRDGRWSCTCNFSIYRKNGHICSHAFALFITWGNVDEGAS